MSATNRSEAAGTGHVRDKDDYYSTPTWITKLILPHLQSSSSPIIYDPCAGTGAIFEAAKQSTGWTSAQFEGTEINNERVDSCDSNYNVIQGNFLSEVAVESFDSIYKRPTHVITNPPYKLALEFIEHSLNIFGELSDNCIGPQIEIAMLLRLNFLGSLKRNKFHKENPCNIYISSKRASFESNNKTDATEYAWFVWNQSTSGRYFILDI